MNEKRYSCPVCGFDGLNEPPYGPDNEPSYEVCPRCGFEPGFDDHPEKEKPSTGDPAEG